MTLLHNIGTYWSWADTTIWNIVQGLTDEEFSRNLYDGGGSIRQRYVHLAEDLWEWYFDWIGVNPGDELEQLVQLGQDKLKQAFGGGSRKMMVIVLLAILGLGLWSAFYTVPSDSVAVIQRFGKYVKEVPPGLHFKFPLGIDMATIVPVKRQLKQEFGFSHQVLVISTRARKMENAKPRW